MPGDGRARRGLPGAAKTIAGGARAFPALILNAAPETSPPTYVSCELDRSRRAVVDLACIAIAMLPSKRLRSLARAWAASLDLAIGGGR